MNSQCRPIEEDDFRRVLYSLDFRFRGRFFELFDKYISVAPDGTVDVKDEHGYQILRELLSCPLEDLQARYVEVSISGNGTIENSTHVLRLLGLAPSLHDELNLDPIVPAASIISEMSRDVEDGYNAGVNPAKLIYLMKLMEQMVLLSDKADLLGSGVCDSWVPGRGYMAVHELSEAVTPTSNRPKFRDTPVLGRLAALYALNHLYNLVTDKMLKNTIRDGLIEALAHCNEDTYGSVSLGTHLGLMTKRNLQQEPRNHGAMIIQDVSKMPFSQVVCGCESTAMVSFRDGLPSFRLSSDKPQVWTDLLGLIIPGGRVAPHIWFHGLKSAHHPDIIGEEKPLVLVPKLSSGSFHRRALDFFSRMEGHPEAVAMVLAAINHLVLPHMSSNHLAIPPSVRNNLTTVYTCLEGACDGCRLPGREIATALLYPEHLEPALIGRENLPVVAFMLFSAQVQQASLIGDGRESEGNGNGHSDGSSMRKLSEAVIEYLWRTRTLNGDNSAEARLKRYVEVICGIHDSVPSGIKKAMDMAGLPDGMATVGTFSRSLAAKVETARRLGGNQPLMLQQR